VISDEQYLKNLQGAVHAFPFELDAPDEEASYFCPGMTLVDYFAGKAMQAQINNPVKLGITGAEDEIACRAYAMARAMMRARR
jgi:hypothetical protein